MNKLPLLCAAAVLALAIGPAGAQQSLSNPDSAFVPQDNPGNWQTTITRTPRGHLIGNPKADAQMIEFVSYTCGHCAQFTAHGEPALELALLMPGKMALEVRPVIRNAIDLTVSLLAACGDPAGFKDRHRAFMLSQDEWLGKARNAPQSQQAIWARGDKAARMNAASALGLGKMLTARGQSAGEVNACLMDDAAAPITPNLRFPAPPASHWMASCSIRCIAGIRFIRCCLPGLPRPPKPPPARPADPLIHNRARQALLQGRVRGYSFRNHFQGFPADETFPPALASLACPRPACACRLQRNRRRGRRNVG